MISLDGYFEGPNKELDWHNVDVEFNEYAVELLDSVELLLFGRTTYELMSGYWPSDYAKENDPLVAARMNNLPKIVFSKTLNKADWQNTKLIQSNIESEIVKLKNLPGKNIALLGNSNLAITLIRSGLIDEFRLFINPTILGNGNSLFAGIGTGVKLSLKSSRVFNSGNILLCYSYPKIII